MARPKRTTRKAAEKTTQTASKNTTTAETTTTETATNEPVAIKPMVPRTAPLAALAATTATPSPVTTSQEVVIQFGGREISGNTIAETGKTGIQRCRKYRCHYICGYLCKTGRK